MALPLVYGAGQRRRRKAQHAKRQPDGTGWLQECTGRASAGERVRAREWEEIKTDGGTSRCWGTHPTRTGSPHSLPHPVWRLIQAPPHPDDPYRHPIRGPDARRAQERQPAGHRGASMQIGTYRQKRTEGGMDERTARQEREIGRSQKAIGMKCANKRAKT